ncbi:hypothetical protein E2562_002074 [Oryza meyeriana var. granulata]|uniref:Uncharacterized protein n=1 Tax=Oryza meyeriana var. granulata TaxID=110450 RepID=A0A6G1EEH9_9ORYZ|nr:hypothetical protein E2562_002074 [Oryza meyeriana var. granulata]
MAFTSLKAHQKLQGEGNPPTPDMRAVMHATGAAACGQSVGGDNERCTAYAAAPSATFPEAGSRGEGGGECGGGTPQGLGGGFAGVEVGRLVGPPFGTFCLLGPLHVLDHFGVF